MNGLSAIRRHRRVAVTLGVLALLLAALVPAVALADGPQQVHLTAKEFSYTPNTVDLTVGQPVQLTIVNAGTVDHDIKSDIPIANLTYQRADNDPSEQSDNAAKGVFDVDFAPGHTSQVTFTPTKAGTYAFACDEPGHTQAGMKGTFVVAAAGAAPAASQSGLPIAQAAEGLGAIAVVGLVAVGGSKLTTRGRKS